MSEEEFDDGQHDPENKDGVVEDDSEETDPLARSIPEAFKHRAKVLSEQTGIDLNEHVSPTGGRSQKKKLHTASDMAILLNMKPEVALEEKRHKTSTDVITKYSQALHDEDLRLAEEVNVYGTSKDRKLKGISQKEDDDIIEDGEEGYKAPIDFVYNTDGLSTTEANIRLDNYGRNEFPEKIIPKWKIFCKQFIAPMPCLLWVAIIIEIIINNILDMCFLLLIQITNATISYYETTKAGDAVAALKTNLKPTATVKRDGTWEVLNAAYLVPGDTILLAIGAAVPADCRINFGEIEVDQAVLTGESLPVALYKGDSVKMGSTVVRGEVECTVEYTGLDTFMGRTASMLGEEKEQSHLERILFKIMLVLVGLSVVLSSIYFTFIVVEDGTRDALSYTVTILVASVPLAIEIVTVTTLAIGSKNLAAHGAIVTKLSAIEDLAGMCFLCADKTGTLTKGHMQLHQKTPIYEKGESQKTVLAYAAMATKWKEPPKDALDRLTLESVKMKMLDEYEQLDYMPFDPEIKRTEGTVKNINTGETFKTSKGAPHIILRLLAEDDDTRDQVENDVAHLGSLGIRSLAVAKTDPQTGIWKMVGLLTFLDPPRSDTRKTLMDASQYGVEIKMITGDHLLIARNTAIELGLGDRIFTADRLPLLDSVTKKKPEHLSEKYGDLCLAASGFAQVYPEHKYLIVECLREMGYTVGMTGDGVNDAPALNRADVGIAVSGATDAARAAADIVFTQEGLGTIVHAIVVAREIFQRVNSFITYRIAATLQLLVFFFISVFAFSPKEFIPPEDLDSEWPVFFHMPVILLMLITLLNDGTLITIAYDNARASPTPNRWNLPALFLISSTLGAVSCASSLLLLFCMLNSWSPTGLFGRLGISGVEYGQIVSAIYLKVSISDFLTLFSARTGPKFFWQVKPAKSLAIGACISLAISSLVSIYLPDTVIDGIFVDGLKHDIRLFYAVWVFSLITFIIQDACKVLLYKWMYRTNFNGIAMSGNIELPETAKLMIEDMETALRTEGAAGQQDNQQDDVELSTRDIV